MVQLMSIRLQAYLKRLSRRMYWLYNLSRAKTGPFSSLNWPIVCEGKGQLELGERARVGGNTELSVGKNSQLRFGSHADISKNSIIRTGEGLTVTIGKHFKLAKK